MLAPTGLDAGLLVSRDDKFIAFEGVAFPGAFIEIEDSVGLDGEDQFWGEKPGDDPGGSARLDRPVVPRRSAFATC
jgi:hypothetical protein